MMRAIRDTMVLAPPLITSEAEIDEIVAKAKDAIDRTASDLVSGDNILQPHGRRVTSATRVEA